MSVKTDKRIRRHKKIRMAMHGTKDMPRLLVFRSNQHIYAQLINDENAKKVEPVGAGCAVAVVLPRYPCLAGARYGADEVL